MAAAVLTALDTAKAALADVSEDKETEDEPEGEEGPSTAASK